MSWFSKRREECYDGPVWVPAGKVRNWFVYVGAYVIRPFVKLLFRYHVKRAAHTPAKGDEAVIFACNHVSYMDPVVMWCALYGIYGGSRFLARSSLFKPLIGGAIARAGAIPIDPDSADRKAIKRAAAALKRGEHVLIFPEGTRMNKPDKVYHPHAGLVLIAQMGKAKIVPVGIKGTERVMPYGRKLPRFPKVYVNMGELIDPKGEQFADAPKRERADIITNAVMEEVFRLRDTADSPDEE